MQVDVSEENENAEEEPYIVENPTLVRCLSITCKCGCCLFLVLGSHLRNWHFLNMIFLLQDIETYASSYHGMAKLSRLMFIADHCPSLRIEALKMAITAVQETYNVTLYQQLHRKLQEAISGYVLLHCIE